LKLFTEHPIFHIYNENTIEQDSKTVVIARDGLGIQGGPMDEYE